MYYKRLSLARSYLSVRGPTNLKPNGTSVKRRQGLRHEARTHDYLRRLYGDLYLPSPWFFYIETSGAFHYAQPDGLLFLPKRDLLLIIEAKLKHTATAFFQTENIYLPLVKRTFPLWDYGVCEVVRWYDRDTPFPAHHKIIESIEDAIPNDFSVHILRSKTYGLSP